eukprot:1141738-Pelagomonas_calceolata.AAC.3
MSGTAEAQNPADTPAKVMYYTPHLEACAAKMPAKGDMQQWIVNVKALTIRCPQLRATICSTNS